MRLLVSLSIVIICDLFREALSFKSLNKPRFKILLNLKQNRDEVPNTDFPGAEPFKTGRHTYASWKSAKENADEFLDNENEIDDMFFVDKIPKNPIMDFFRKIYDTVFFFGLESPQNVQREYNDDYYRNNNEDNYNTNEYQNSPFFSPSERKSQEILSDRKNYSRKKSETVNNKMDYINENINNDNSIEEENIASSTYKEVRTKRPIERKVSSKISSQPKPPSLRDEVNAIEQSILDIQEQIQVADITIAALKSSISSPSSTTPNDIIKSHKLSNTILRKEQLINELNILQVRFITIRSKLDKEEKRNNSNKKW